MEKTDAQIEREKQAVASMTGAKANMIDVLGRVQTLEKELNNASNVISRMKRHVGAESKMTWHDGRQEQLGTVQKFADDAIAEIAKTLSK